MGAQHEYMSLNKDNESLMINILHVNDTVKPNILKLSYTQLLISCHTSLE